jgi:hypothetical protein
VRDALRRALGERYVRVQTPLDFGAERAFDDASRANLEALQRTAEDLVARERLALASLSALLAA